MNIGITTVIDNIGLSFEWVVVLINLLGSMVFTAKDFKLGIMILMITSGAIFVWFYEVGYNYVYPLVMFFLALITLILTLYAVNKTSTTGGFN